MVLLNRDFQSLIQWRLRQQKVLKEVGCDNTIFLHIDVYSIGETSPQVPHLLSACSMSAGDTVSVPPVLDGVFTPINVAEPFSPP